MIDRLVNHWTDLPGFTPGRALYACYLTGTGQSDLHRLVDAYQAELVDMGDLDLIRREWLHMTVQGISFTDELTAAEMDRVAAAIGDGLADVRPPVAQAGAAVLSRDAVYLPVTPAEPFVALRDAIRAAIAGAVPADRLYALPGQHDGRFAPHVSLAYVNTPGPAAPVAERLAGVAAAPAELHYEHASLIALRRENRRWAWTDEIRIPIGAPVHVR